MGKKAKQIFSYVGVEDWMTTTDIRNSAIATYIQEQKAKGVPVEEMVKASSETQKHMREKWDFVPKGDWIKYIYYL